MNLLADPTQAATELFFFFFLVRGELQKGSDLAHQSRT